MADKKCIQQMTEIQKSSILKMPLQYSLHLHMNRKWSIFKLFCSGNIYGEKTRNPNFKHKPSGGSMS